MNKTNESTPRRGHPIIIISHMRWILLTGLLPLIRGILGSFRGDFSVWTNTSWVDFAVLFSIIILAVVRWYRCTFVFTDDYIKERRGVLFSTTTQIPWDNITLIKVRTPYYTRPFGACYLRLDTMGGSFRSADINLCLTVKDSHALTEHYLFGRISEGSSQHFRPRFLSILSLSLISINSFIGIFYMATFISQSGQILGRDFADFIVNTLERLAKRPGIGVPPAASALALIIIATWIIGVISTLLRYHRYEVTAGQTIISTKSGFASRQLHIINRQRIGYYNIRQNILAHVLGLYSLYIYVIGSGKERSDMDCIIPNSSYRRFSTTANELLGSVFLSPVTLRPQKHDFFRYIVQPLILIGLDTLMTTLIFYFLPNWRQFILFIGVMFLIPSLAFLVVRLKDYASCGIGKSENDYIMRYSTGLIFHHVIIPENRIVKVRLTQSPLQRWNGSCSVYVYTLSEQIKRHKCRNLSVSGVKEMFPDWVK